MCEWVMHGTALDGSVASEGVTSDTPTAQGTLGGLCKCRWQDER